MCKTNNNAIPNNQCDIEEITEKLKDSKMNENGTDQKLEEAHNTVFKWTMLKLERKAVYFTA